MPPRSSVKQPSRRSTRLSSVEQPPRFALPNSSDNFYGNNNVIPPARGGRPPPANEDAEDNRIFREVAESDDELQDEFIGGPGSSPSSRSAASMTRSPRKRNVKSSLNSQNNMHLSDAMGGLRFRDTQHERSITGLPPPSNEREPFAPENPPTSDGSLFMRDEEDIQDNPRAGLNNPYSARYPSLQPFQPASSSLAAKFGVAGGRTSTMSLSPVRPDTSRSFNHEGDIFRVAAIRTPTPASQASAATPPLSVLPSPPVIEQTRRSNTPEHPEPKQTNPAAPVTQQPLPDRHVDELPRALSSLYPSALLGVFGGSDTRSVISRLFESRNSHWFRLRVDEDGSVEVPQAIYHAIQEAAAKAGKSITFTDDSHSDLTNRQWEQIEKHLKEIGVITPKGKKEKGKGAEEIPKIVKHEVQDALDKWLKENNAAVDRILGSANPAKSEKEIRRLFDEYSKSLNGTHKFVNRDELAGLIQKEVRKPQAEYQKEFQILMDRVQEFEKAMAKYQAEPPKGMSEAEVRAIVKDAVAKAVSYAQLEASARAAINSHLVDHLANQVNFFGAGSGAVIDPTYTTPNWRLPKFAYKSKKWFERDGYKPQPPRIAIEPWSEEGECWCAGTEGSKSHAAGTASLSVLMSRDMVPRHLVLEHILSGATLDPGAMPREVEVWAKFEELGLQRTVESWSRGRWPAEDRVPTVLHAGFVKLGHFVYEDRNAGDGAQVFKLDDEVARMKAATNHVVVRALSNYGAEDHTCIYRVRMYGDVVERDSYDY
ncbi:hypothetical protein BX600DRAFT_504416 [Xylariales sp. PMI_506]|nr:hypothetical protein BX600DRAFT_504416 [Xylariales sp. PMI_506]